VFYIHYRLGMAAISHYTIQARVSYQTRLQESDGKYVGLNKTMSCNNDVVGSQLSNKDILIFTSGMLLIAGFLSLVFLT